MISKILTNFDFAMVLSKTINIYSIIIQALLIAASFSVLSERFPKIAKVINIIAFLFLIFTGVFMFNGMLSAQVVDEFQGMVYFGQVENGKANGWGRLFDEQRNIKYIGYFQNNIYEGKGCLYSYINKGESWKLSFRYDGEFKGGNYFGYGKSYFYDDSKELPQYEGEYRDGLYCGTGAIIYYDEHNNKIGYYDGSWAYGTRFGFGVCEWYNPDDGFVQKYVGTYVSDEYSGQGTYYRDDEMIYAGDWLKDQYDGQGTYYYTEKGEKRKYVGGFSGGLKNGYGQIYDENDNLLLEGEFREGELVKK